MFCFGRKMRHERFAREMRKVAALEEIAQELRFLRRSVDVIAGAADTYVRYEALKVKAGELEARIAHVTGKLAEIGDKGEGEAGS